MQNIPERLVGQIAPLGIVDAEIDDLLTVKADFKESDQYSDKFFNIGSICCSEDRQTIGSIVDLMGPTIMPYYVVKKTASFLGLISPEVNSKDLKVKYILILNDPKGHLSSQIRA